MARVLVVTEDPTERATLSRTLGSSGHEVESIASHATALTSARALRPDLVVLDVDVAAREGVETCRALRDDVRTSGAAIFAILETADEQARVTAFEAGVDDLVSRPYSVRELVLRLRALLRRRRAPPARAALIDAGGLRIDAAARRVAIGGRALVLTRREFDVLLLLAQAKGRVLSRESLVAHAWTEDVGSVRVVDTTIKRLRPKLGRVASRLQTVRGTGYRLAVDESEAD